MHRIQAAQITTQYGPVALNAIVLLGAVAYFHRDLQAEADRRTLAEKAEADRRTLADKAEADRRTLAEQAAAERRATADREFLEARLAPVLALLAKVEEMAAARQTSEKKGWWGGR